MDTLTLMALLRIVGSLDMPWSQETRLRLEYWPGESNIKAQHPYTLQVLKENGVKYLNLGDIIESFEYESAGGLLKKLEELTKDISELTYVDEPELFGPYNRP